MTRLLLGLRGADERPATYEVVEPFDRCLDLIYPLAQPSSALEGRSLLTFTLVDGGGRILIRPEAVAVIEEVLGDG